MDENYINDEIDQNIVKNVMNNSTIDGDLLQCNDDNSIYRIHKNDSKFDNQNNDRFSTGFLESIDLLDINSLDLDNEENWLQSSEAFNGDEDGCLDSDHWMRAEFEAVDSSQPYYLKESLLNILNNLQDQKSRIIIPKIQSAKISPNEIKPDLINIIPDSNLTTSILQPQSDSTLKPEPKSRPKRERTFIITDEDEKSPFSPIITSSNSSLEMNNFVYSSSSVSDFHSLSTHGIPNAMEDTNSLIKYKDKSNDIHLINNKNRLSNGKNLTFNKSKKLLGNCSLDYHRHGKSNDSISNNYNDVIKSNLRNGNLNAKDENGSSSDESLYYEASPNPLILMRNKPYGSFDDCLEAEPSTFMQFGDVQSAAKKQEEFLKESFVDLSVRKSSRLTRSTDIELDDPPQSFNRKDIPDSCQRSMPNLMDQLSLVKPSMPTHISQTLDSQKFKKPLEPQRKFSAPRVLDAGNIVRTDISSRIKTQHLNGGSYYSQASNKLTIARKLNQTFTKENGHKYNESNIPESKLIPHQQSSPMLQHQSYLNNDTNHRLVNNNKNTNSNNSNSIIAAKNDSGNFRGKSCLPRPSGIPRPSSLSKLRPPSKSSMSIDSKGYAISQRQWSPAVDNNF